MKVPLAGADAAGNPTETLLSEVGPVLLRLFDMAEACTLRLVCREFLEAVRRQHQWDDGVRSVISSRCVILNGHAAWRACFPRARSATVQDADDCDLVHFKGLQSLRLWGSSHLTGAGFVHLHGIHTLSINDCIGVTDAAFEHLHGIHTLHMWGCSEDTISAARDAQMPVSLSLTYE